jgi:hypothetical protein
MKSTGMKVHILQRRRKPIKQTYKESKNEREREREREREHKRTNKREEIFLRLRLLFHVVEEFNLC